MKKLIIICFALGVISDTVKAQLIQTNLSKKTAEALIGLSKNFNYSGGRVTVRFSPFQPAKDDIKTFTTPLSSAKCLTKEQVKGQKIENEQIIADGTKAEAILPGAVIDAEVLLKSGQFSFIKMDKRKPVTLSTPSNLVKRSTITVSNTGTQDFKARLVDARQTLTVASNMRNPDIIPNVGSASNMSMSTLEEKASLAIGASAFYMGISAEDNFKFSSEKYRYMYLYEFEQRCITVMANTITSPEDLFTDNAPSSSNWMYIPEVSYGRRVYVVVESQYDLEKYSNELSGSLNWGVVAAAYSQENSGSSLLSTTNVRIFTEGGTAIPLTDVKKLQATLDNHFKVPFKQIELVPIAYKLNYLDGKPVSILSEAFLDSDKCLSTNKVKVRIKEIVCEVSDDGDGTEQVYGAMAVNLYSASGQQLMPDGKTNLPGNGIAPTGSVIYARENGPLTLKAGTKPKQFDANSQDTYVELNVSNLDMKIEVKPWMKEKDDISDDTFITTGTLRKSLRQMLMDGSALTTFEFRHDRSVVKLTIEIVPSN